MNENQNVVEINISRDFTLYPGARYISDGEYSGEEFFDSHLKPTLESVWDDPDRTVLIDFDGTFGYASSFISEVFIRTVKYFKDKERINKKLHFKSEDDPLLIESIKKIINNAEVE